MLDYEPEWHAHQGEEHLQPSNDQPTPEEMALAKRLFEARTAHGLTQEEVAAQVGLSRVSISNIEHAWRKVYANELARFARLFNTTPGALLGHENETLEMSKEEALVRQIIAETRLLCPEDQWQVVRFAKFLLHAGRAPALKEVG